MDTFQDNPFGLLTFLVAPAMLTNASSIMVLSASNRFRLAIDSVRAIVADIENRHAEPGPETAQRLEHLKVAEKRVLLLVRALTALYLTVGSFVAASLVALLGAVLFVEHQETLRQLALIGSRCAGITGVGGLLTACAILIWESPIALRLLTDETNFKARSYDPRFIERLPQATVGTSGSFEIVPAE